MVRLEPGHSVPGQRHDDRSVAPVYLADRRSAADLANAASISSIDRPLVSMPRIRKATAASAAQNARKYIAGRIAPTLAAGLTKSVPPTISAKPSGLMILPKFPTPYPRPM